MSKVVFSGQQILRYEKTNKNIAISFIAYDSIVEKINKSSLKGKLFSFLIGFFIKKWTSKIFCQKVLRRGRRASYICLSSFFNPSPKWKVEVVTQETNPVYWAYTHCTHYCLTLEPWTVIFFNFIFISFELENCSSKKIGLYSTNWFWNDLN